MKNLSRSEVTFFMHVPIFPVAVVEGDKITVLQPRDCDKTRVVEVDHPITATARVNDELVVVEVPKRASSNIAGKTVVLRSRSLPYRALKEIESRL